MKTTIRPGGHHFPRARYSIVPLDCGHSIRIEDEESSEPGRTIDCPACDMVQWLASGAK